MPRAKLGSSRKQKWWLVHYFTGGAGGLPGGGSPAHLGTWCCIFSPFIKCTSPLSRLYKERLLIRKE